MVFDQVYVRARTTSLAQQAESLPGEDVDFDWVEYLSEYRRLGPLALDSKNDKWFAYVHGRQYVESHRNGGGMDMPFGRSSFGPWSPCPEYYESFKEK